MTEKKNKGGRPRTELDIEMLKSLAEIQCTAQECASVLKTSIKTIDRRLKEEGYEGFDQFYKMYADEGKTSLRRAQWQAAMAGNTGMLVWLGKQMLGQKDKSEHDHNHKINPVEAAKAVLNSYGDPAELDSRASQKPN